MSYTYQCWCWAYEETGDDGEDWCFCGHMWSDHSDVTSECLFIVGTVPGTLPVPNEEETNE